MTERQVFGLVVRAIGIILAFYSLSLWLLVAARLMDPKDVPHRFPITEDVLFGTVWLVVARVLLIPGDWLVRLSCGPESN